MEADRHLISFLFRKLSEAGAIRNPASVRERVVIVALGAVMGLVLPALVFPLTSSGADEPGRLVATVGPDFTIRVDDANGQRVSSLPEGAYTLLVRDLSNEHNFVLADEPAGLELRIETGVEFVGEQSFEIKLESGRYTYACSPHWQTMNGGFSVFAKPSPAPTPPPRIRAGVTAGGSAYAPRSLKAGRYRVVVSDRSAKRNFRLRGPGVNRATGVSFRGTARWTVRLARGTYRFGSDPEPLEGRLRVR
jgi:hypothetical protein